MRQFRFIGDPDNWAWKPELINGNVYNADYSGYEHQGVKSTVLGCFEDIDFEGSRDWEEVTNDK